MTFSGKAMWINPWIRLQCTKVKALQARPIITEGELMEGKGSINT
jgi:hypothetical protein